MSIPFPSDILPPGVSGFWAWSTIAQASMTLIVDTTPHVAVVLPLVYGATKKQLDELRETVKRGMGAPA